MHDAPSLLAALSMDSCGVPDDMRDAYDKQQLSSSLLVDLGVARLRKTYGPETSPLWLEAAAMVCIAAAASAEDVLQMVGDQDLPVPMRFLGLVASRVGVAFACRARAVADYPELLRDVPDDHWPLANEAEFELLCAKRDALQRFRDERSLILSGTVDGTTLQHVIGSDTLLKVARVCPGPERAAAVILGSAMGTVCDMLASFLGRVIEDGDEEYKMAAQAYANGLTIACAVIEEWAAGRLEWTPIPGVNWINVPTEECDA